MARLILKCPYLKGGSEKTSAHLENLVNYIATRDGVEKINIENRNLSSTSKQGELIAQIIKAFPDTKNLFEYEDYIRDSTIENASEFISVALEQNVDKIGKRKNYVDYIANRPGAQKIGKHGLFTGGDDSLVLSRIADEVANHTGNVWTPIVSLRREDATRLGFDNAESWHNMLSYYAIDIAESLKIKSENFQWYAAFHNEGHHPHIHMICYSTNPKEGYLTKKGIEKMKSGFVKNIFGQELQGIYIEQSKRRDELKAQSRDVLLQLISGMKNSDFQNSKLEEQFINLADRLKFSKGKKQYGYLQPQLKAMVDGIVDELAKDERIKKVYDFWYEMRNEVLHSYMDNLPEPLPLSQQKEFKSIKNMIIKEADNLNEGIISFEEIIGYDTDINDESIDKEIDDIFINDTKFVETEVDTLDLIQEVEVNDDITKDVYVKWSDEYKEAREFLVGTDDIAPDFERAFKIFLLEAENGNALAMFDIGRMLADGLGMDIDLIQSHEWYKKALIGFLNLEKQNQDDKIQYRLGWMLQNGIGTEKDIEEAKKYFEKSAKLGNQFAQYSLGKLYLDEKYMNKDILKGMELFKLSAEQGNEYAAYQLGKLYLKGEDVAKDIPLAIKWLYLSAEKGNQYGQYLLGKIYLIGEGVPVDKEEAIKWFTLSAEQGNEYAQFFLDNMDRFHNPSVSLIVSKMFHHMGKIFEDNVPLKSSGIGIKIDSKLLRKLREKKIAQGHKKDEYGQQITH